VPQRQDDRLEGPPALANAFGAAASDSCCIIQHIHHPEEQWIATIRWALALRLLYYATRALTISRQIRRGQGRRGLDLTKFRNRPNPICDKRPHPLAAD
jgi:hypothetical protein